MAVLKPRAKAKSAVSGRFVGTGIAGGRPNKSSREKHGIGGLRQLVKAAMTRETPITQDELDGRTRVAKAMRELRVSLIEEQGGFGAVTPQMELLVDLVITDQLIIGSVDAYMAGLVTSGTIVDTDKNGRIALAPIVRERAYLADSMARRLALLGLERMAPPEQDLTSYLREAEAKRRAAEAQDAIEVEAEVEPKDEE